MKKIFSLLVVVLLMLSMVFVAPLAIAGATIWTDKADYGPDETVTIYGSGFLIYAEVTITITAPDSSEATIYAWTDGSGAFTAQHKLNGMEGTYTVTATDETNTAETTFAETVKRYYTASIFPTTSYTLETKTYTLTITNSLTSNKNLGSATIDIPSGFTSVSISSVTASPPRSWSGTIVSGVIKLESAGNSELRPGEYVAVTFSATAPATAGIYYWNTKAYEGRGWSGDLFTLIGSQPKVTVSAPPTVSITITSSPVTGTGFVKVDDTPITTPTTFVWTIGSTHKLEALSPVSGGAGIQYVWTSWSDGGAQTHTYTVPSSSETVTANYKTQYYLTLDTDPSGVTTPTGEGWYDANTYADISTDEYIDIVPGESRYRFDSWTTDDMTEITDPSATFTTVLMDKPKTVTANYVVQYYITFDQTGVGSDFSGTVVTVDAVGYDVAGLPVSFWWDENSVHDFAFDSPLVPLLGKQYVWTSTTGLSTLQIDTLTITSSGSVTGNYKIQYYLTVCTVPEGLEPTPTPQSGWYDECTYVTLTAPSTAHIGNIVYNFACWQINQQFQNHLLNPITIHMDSPKIACARYCELGDPIGDINLDGKVDMTDIATIAKHYGAKLGERNYSVECDLNLDGKIDLIDLAAAARNFSA